MTKGDLMFTTRKSVRAALAGVATAAVAGAGLAAAGAAQAAPVHARGYSDVESCTGMSGSVSYSPGLLRGTARNQRVVVRGTLTGCSGISGAQEGTGTVTAVLTGRSKVGSIAATGTVTVNWPAASGLNPSNGTFSIRRTGTSEPLLASGSVTTGAFQGAVLSSSLLVTGHTGRGTVRNPIRHQTFTNMEPFAARVNLG
jgi:hypothetical protein